jgi:hypothetical protein
LAVDHKNLKESVRHKLCPDKISLDISVKYPSDTGNAKVDSLLEGEAKDFAAKAKAEGLAGPLKMGFACEFDENLFASSGFLAHFPGPGILSVLLTKEEFMGGAHADVSFGAHNFEMRSGEEIGFSNLFKSPRDGLSKLYDFARHDLCSITPSHARADRAFGVPCDNQGRAPADILGLSGPLDNMGHMVLTEAGAVMNFAPFEIWTTDKGPHQLAIPKEALLRMGAHDLWGGSREAPAPKPDQPADGGGT